MSNFTSRIQTKEGTLQFYFNRLLIESDFHYHISVTDRKNKSHIFLMQEEDGAWIIVDESKIPYWLKLVEGDLDLAIKLSLKV